MKKIKLLTIVLAIVLITAISFFGIYGKKQGRITNNVKGYSYGMDIEGARQVKLVPNNENKTIIKDSEGKKVEDSEDLTDEEIAEKGYTKEEVPYNSEEDKNVENYKKSKKVIEERLNKIGVEQYNIKLNEENGEIFVELPEKDEVTDRIISNMGTTGKFEILDKDTEEVLMTNSDIKEVKVLYGSNNNGSLTSSGTVVYLDILFNKEGSKKLEDISNTYVKKDETEKEETEENEETGENENTEETKENEEKEKTITMKIDEQEIMSTSFEEPIKNGELRLSVGAASKDQETLQENIEKASNMANVLGTNNLPLKYDLDTNEFVFANIDKNNVQIAKYVLLAIMALALVYLVFKFKVKGILTAFSFIGFISILMLLIRYTNVVLSNEGYLAVGLISLLNYIFIYKMLTGANIKDLYSKVNLRLIPVYIFTVVCCFMSWLPISSFGMVMFWGFTLIAVYNILVTNTLIKIKDGSVERK